MPSESDYCKEVLALAFALMVACFVVEQSQTVLSLDVPL